ncbi:alcohol-forming fatty acyl-CoA reductase-like [Gossypium australe]|uniref:Alcohol-forming fatty acyl-CoA reductase-like n=1 Tax=Gossypium australe TaxID=47621 RepID=A0A5B6WYU7_9ROSI|nr:alcohol-forming fatty acyl-CoA reductase-like [Gossypium australe]
MARHLEDKDAADAIVMSYFGLTLIDSACDVAIKLGIGVEKTDSTITILAEHIDCALKRVMFKIGSGKELVMVSERQNYLSNVISIMVAKKMVRKGCEAFLTYV